VVVDRNWESDSELSRDGKGRDVMRSDNYECESRVSSGDETCEKARGYGGERRVCGVSLGDTKSFGKWKKEMGWD